MSKAIEYLAEIGLKWQNNKGYKNPYEAIIDEDAWNRIVRTKRLGRKESLGVYRHQILKEVFQSNGTLEIVDGDKLKKQMKFTSFMDLIPEKMLKDVNFKFGLMNGSISPYYKKLRFKEYFDYDQEKLFHFFNKISPISKSDFSSEEKLEKQMREGIEEVVKEVIENINEIQLEEKLKFIFIDLLVEDYLENQKKEIEERKNEETKKTSKKRMGVLDLIRSIAKPIK